MEHRLHIDHPVIVGRLVDTDHRPIPNTHFTVMCRSKSEVLSYLGGDTDDQGWFVTYLSASATGKGPAAITFWRDGRQPVSKRVVGVCIQAVLVGKITVGDVVMPGRR